ncbi:MAG: type VI secretion system tip protein TssI/VgrG [Polyangiaceae bacterium]
MKKIEVSLRSPDFSADALQVGKVRGREAISQPFEFTVDVVCEDPESFDFDLVGKRASLVFLVDGAPERTVAGIISHTSESFSTKRGHSAAGYRLVLVPELWRLGLAHAHQVFLEKSIPDIVQQKLKDAALLDFDLRLSGTYGPKAMVVQYDETDRAFVNRLTENQGISYYFRNADGIEKLVFTDDPTGFAAVEGHPSVAVRLGADETDVYELQRERTAISKTWKVQDYNHHLPLLDIVGTFTESHGLSAEVVEFGPYVLTPQEAQALAKRRAEARVAQTDYYRGASDRCWFPAGALVKREGDPRVPESTPLLLVEVEHDFVQSTSAADRNTIETTYRNEFRAVDGQRAYRPPLVTPRPRIDGVLTATVEPLQPPGGNPTTVVPTIDAAGDYTIRFHFDPAPKYPAPGSRVRSSLPVRRMQALAGPNYGIHFPLRGGIEVFVVFIGGDPDRPIIAGAVPNAITTSPSTQTNALQSVMRTQSGITMTFKDDGSS